MRQSWKGFLTLGLIFIPIKLYKASETNTLDFDYLRKNDLCQVGYVRVCKETGEVVPFEEIVKGYKNKNGEMIVMDKEDFKKANVEKTNSIKIMSFVNENEIDAKYFEQPFFIEPQKGAEKVYLILKEALSKTKKVGIGKYVLSTREHLAIIKPEKDYLLLINARFPSQIRSIESLNIPKKAEVTKEELETAIELINKLTTKFQEERYIDTYIEELKRIITAKANGQKIKETKFKVPTLESASVLQQLRKSLQTAQPS